MTNLGKIQGEGRELKAKSVVLGKVSLNLAELASKMETDIQTKLPISLQVAGIAMEATLSVSFELHFFYFFSACCFSAML